VTDSTNLDLVRSIHARWERGDFRDPDWADPEIEYVITDGPERGTFRGRAGLAEAVGTLFREFEDVRVEAEHYRELDAERVLVLARGFGHGKLSGVPISGKSAEVFEVHDGKVTRIVVYNDRDRALADLGLEG
jgi:ketosteroid isomerase-like protein